jgi:hypothetical protein
MDASTATTVCIAVPPWFWFGLLLLLFSFTLPAASDVIGLDMDYPDIYPDNPK